MIKINNEYYRITKIEVNKPMFVCRCTVLKYNSLADAESNLNGEKQGKNPKGIVLQGKAEFPFEDENDLDPIKLCYQRIMAKMPSIENTVLLY